MSRRRSSVFEDLVELAARLPWWLCLVLAALAYLGFGALAATPLQVTGKPDASLIYGSSLRGAALAAKIAVPLLLVVAAGVSALRRLQARKLVETARAAGPQAAVDGMSWAEFERLNQRVASLRTDTPTDAKYLLAQMRSPGFRRKVLEAVSQTLQPNLSPVVLKDFEIHWPAKGARRKIAADVDRRFSIVREVQAEVDANLKRAQALRQAVLARAFAGANEAVPSPT